MITSRDNELIKNTAKLVKSVKNRHERGLFTAEGVRICCDGIQSGFTPEVFFFTEKSKEKYNAEFKIISAASKKYFEISQSVFERLSDTKSPQGFLCVFNMLDKQKIPYTINSCGSYIALERIQDPTNLGTVLRTAEALGINGVIMSEDCCDFYSPKVVRGSMGAVFRIPIMIKESFVKYIEELTNSGIPTYGSTPRAAEDITNLKFNGGVMLIGNEGRGLSDEALSVCSKKIKIPMGGRAESLNAAAAAAILMWEFLK